MSQRELESARRILVVRLGAIGDALRVLPALARLRRERPDAEIGWVVEHWVHPLLDGHPSVDRFHVIDRRSLDRSWGGALAELRRASAEIRSRDYEVALDFHGRLKSGVVTRLSGARWRIGYAKENATEANHLFTNVHVSLEDNWENRVLRFLHLLAPLGIDSVYDPGQSGLWLADDERERARDWHAGLGGPRVAAFPGSSEGRSHERWPTEKWVALLARLAAAGLSPVVFWGPSEAELAREIADEAGDGVTLAPKTSLQELMAAIACFEVFVGSDTAAMHMAWMQGVPTAVIAGGKPPRTVAPLPPVPSRVLRAERHLQEGVRPSRQSPRVVTDVSVDDVERAVLDLRSSGR